MNKKSLRRERFENVAARRVQRIIDYLDSLSNCSNKSNYEYSDEDVKKMFRAIRDAVTKSETTFSRQINKESKNNFKF